MRFDLRYTGLRVRDLDRSVAFYTEVLGLSLLRRVPVAETKGELAVVGREGAGHVLELNWYADDSPFGGAYETGDALDHLAFQVNDLDAVLDHLAAHGHAPVTDVRRSKNAAWTFVEDPDGVWIELFAHTKRAEG